MSDEGVWKLLSGCGIKLAVISEALHIPSINHVMDYAPQYQVAGWTLPHGTKNLLPAVC